MALIQNGLHKVQIGVGTLALRAEADRSIRVVRIRNCGPCDLRRHVELTIDRKSVGFFRIACPDDQVISCSDLAMNQMVESLIGIGMQRRLSVNIFDWMKAYGQPFTYPVAEGQTFRMDVLVNQQMDVEYDLYDAGDVLSTEINGTDSNEFLYIERGTNAAAIPVGSTQHMIVDSVTPAQFPDFPFQGIAGARSTFEIYGIIGQPVSAHAAGAMSWTTDRLQLIHDREILLDPDRVGLQFLGDVTFVLNGILYNRVNSVVGHNMTPLDVPLMFNPPLRFEPGAELNTIVTFTAASLAAAAETLALDVGYIMKETKG